MATMRTITRATLRGHGKARMGAVLAAVLSAAIVWSMAALVVGDLRQPAFGGAAPQHLNAATVSVASLIGGLLGWASLSLVERLPGRTPRTWTMLAVSVLVVSLGLPFSGHGISLTNRVSLVLMHVAVGCVLIPLLARTATTAKPRKEE